MDAPLNTPHSAFRIPHCHEVRQRPGAPLTRDSHQPTQDPGRGGRIRARPVAALDLDPEEPRQGVETARLEGGTRCRARRSVQTRGPWSKSERARSSSTRRNVQSKRDRKSTRLNSSHLVISYAVFCLKKKTKDITNSLYKRKPYHDPETQRN